MEYKLTDGSSIKINAVAIINSAGPDQFQATHYTEENKLIAHPCASEEECKGDIDAYIKENNLEIET